ncbi:hypothetical protein FSP39_012248 [Pinctada imbricata]|uniref:MAM domain-containing protein n=1 Tax=Pinctada imbricata TaxID=66713 RepID=A0AA89BM90_PINIB|nr:hypothetical protein FSP39_012248 [Pinctada imbricata]
MQPEDAHSSKGPCPASILGFAIALLMETNSFMPYSPGSLTPELFATPYEDIGPSYARTGDGFLMADMATQGSLYEVAHFVTAFPLKAEDRCLSFFYNMNGQYTSTLNVKSKASQSTYFNTIWSTHGNQGPKWHYAEVILSAQRNLQLSFEAVKGPGSSVIGLDNITLTPGSCKFGDFNDTIHITTKGPRKIDLSDYVMDFEGIGWINFEVHACYDAILELQTERKTSNDSYKIVLGAGDNKWAFLQKFVKGKKEKQLQTIEPNLDCDNYKPFWFGWKNNKLQLGRGFVYGEDVMFTGTDHNPHGVRHVIVRSHPKANWIFYKGNCVSGFGKCEDKGYCVIPEEVCDNINNCADGTDEKDCVFPACDVSEFRCTYGKCFPGTVACDGEIHCSDNSDELDCPIHAKPHTYISLSHHGFSASRNSVFKFTVKTCSDSWVTLWKGRSKIFEVGIGRGGNKWSSLQRIGGSSVYHHGKIVDCGKFIPLYVNWSGSIVSVGKGQQIGQDIFLKLEDSYVSQIDEIRVGSYAKDVFYNIDAALPQCANNEFRCGYGRCIANSNRCDGIKHCTDGSDEKDCPILVQKWGKDVISNHMYKISGLDWINFEVKSCADAFVTLLQGGNVMFGVMLGRGGNSWNSLINYVTEQEKHKSNTPVFDCNIYKQFWFSWSDGQLKVGQGLYRGNNLLLEQTYDSPVNIDDVQLGSYANDNTFRIRQGNCFDGFFKCSENDHCISSNFKCDKVSDCAASGGSDEQGCKYPLCDPDRDFKCGNGMCYPFEKMCDGKIDCRDNTDEIKCPIRTAPHTSEVVSNQGFSGRSWVNFKVKTCADAHILLAKDVRVIYEILLGRGDDLWSSIQKDKKDRIWKNGKVLDCDEFLPFWVSWKNGDIQVGKGLKRFENMYLSWSDERFETVNDVKVKSYSQEGEWYFEQAIEIPVLWTSSFFDLEPYGITGKGRDTLTFTTNACHDVWVGLMPNKHETSTMYKIGIGRGGNKFNTILKNGTQKKRSDSAILTCYIKHLWVTWKNGRIAAGEGIDITKNVVIEWTDDDPLTVNDIGVSSWNEKWTFQNFDLQNSTT